MARKRHKREPLSAQEWALYLTLDDLILEKQERNMSVAEWRYKKLKELALRGGMMGSGDELTNKRNRSE